MGVFACQQISVNFPDKKGTVISSYPTKIHTNKKVMTLEA